MDTRDGGMRDMMTPREALFRAMFSEGWFTATSGGDEFGYSFGYVTNITEDLIELFDAFADVVDAYGKPAEYEVEGTFYVIWNSDEFVDIFRVTTDEAMALFEDDNERYAHWLNSVDDASSFNATSVTDEGIA